MSHRDRSCYSYYSACLSTLKEYVLKTGFGNAGKEIRFFQKSEAYWVISRFPPRSFVACETPLPLAVAVLALGCLR